MAANSVPPVPSGASSSSGTTSDAKFDKKKDVHKIELDDYFSSVSGSNDFTITDDLSGDQISELEIKKLGGKDNDVDVVRVDLATFDDDFDLTLQDEGSEDQLYFDNIDSISSSSGGTYTITYTGSDGSSHTVDVDPGDASVFYSLADTRDGYVNGTAGDDTIGAGYTDADGDMVDGNDALLSGASGDEDFIIGNGGDDTISGGAQDDIIYGDAGPPSPRDTMNWADTGLTNGSTAVGGTTISVSGSNISTGSGSQQVGGLTGDADTPVDAARVGHG